MKEPEKIWKGIIILALAVAVYNAYLGWFYDSSSGLLLAVVLLLLIISYITRYSPKEHVAKKVRTAVIFLILLSVAGMALMFVDSRGEVSFPAEGFTFSVLIILGVTLLVFFRQKRAANKEAKK